MKFIADDGKIFDTMSECEEYEKMNSEGKEIARLWNDYITMYHKSGRAVESQYDWNENTQAYLDETAAILSDSYTEFISITCSNYEWEKVHNYFENEYGVSLPSYARGIHYYDNNTEEWISFDNDYKNFKKKWASVGIHF